MQPLIWLPSFLIGVRFAKPKTWDLVTLLENNVIFRKRQTALEKTCSLCHKGHNSAS